MTELRNIELKTVTKLVKSNVPAHIGGQVPAGMKRWVTFVSVDNGKTLATGASHLGVYFASVSTANAVIGSLTTTTHRKHLLHLRSTQTTGFRKPPITVPKVPNVDTPLFSIAESKYLGVFATRTTAQVTVQYFDE